MTMSGALARTRTLLGSSKPHPMAMSKWWKKAKPVEAEITMHLSPHEQAPVLPWIKTFPKKVQNRVTTYLWPFGSVAFMYVVFAATDAQDKQEDLDHRF